MPFKHKVIYLAAPYSHPHPMVRQQRFELISKVAGILQAAGYLVFSPISHGHPIAQNWNLPTDYAFWQRHCEAFVERCDEVLVLKIDGWCTSNGVALEVEEAERLRKPVSCISAEDALSLVQMAKVC